MKAVDPDVAIRHDAVEIDEDAFRGIGFGQSELLSVPADTGGEKAARAAGCVLRIKRPGDAPIVRHVNCAPGGIVEGGLLGAGGVGLQKAPARVKGDDRALLELRRRRGNLSSEKQREQGQVTPHVSQTSVAWERSERRSQKQILSPFHNAKFSGGAYFFFQGKFATLIINFS